MAWKSGHTSRLNKLTNLRFNLKSKINYYELISHDTNKHRISFLIIWANIKIVENWKDISGKLKGWRKKYDYDIQIYACYMSYRLYQ